MTTLPPDGSDLHLRGRLPDDPDDPVLPPDLAKPKRNGTPTNGKSNGKKKANPFAHNSFALDAQHESDVAEQCIAALSEKAPDVYKRAGMLVRVLRDEPPEGSLRSAYAPRLEPLPKAVLRARLDALGAFIDDAGKTVHPPFWLVELVDQFGHWRGIRGIEGVVQSPVIRPDGTVLETPGYDSQTGLLYEPNDEFLPVRPCPTRQDAEAALAELLEVVEDFPFEQEKHRAAFISLMLTPFARYAFNGPVPLGVIDGTVAGVGKGLLAQIIATLVDGCDVPPTPPPVQEDEERKLITSIAMAGSRLVLIDNVTRPVGSGALEALLTTTRWKDRVLGASKTWEGDVTACWLLTGNNVQFRKKDTIRRVVHVRLQSRVETPEARSNWRHSPLKAWVKQERGRLVRAILTILRAHAVAGSPGALVPWGSFEGWSQAARAPVVWLGMPDPADTRQELAEVADTEVVALKALLTRWLRHQDVDKGMTCKRALEVARDDSDLHSAIEELCPVKAGREVTTRRLGLRLRDIKGRVVGIETEYAFGGPSEQMVCLENTVDRVGSSWWRAVVVE